MTGLVLAVSLELDTFRLEVEHVLSLQGINALYGASGAGKSTLLRIIAGLETRARGSVRYNGEIWQQIPAAGRRAGPARHGGTFRPPHQRGIGYVFQDARLFPHLDVRGNLQYAERRSRRIGGRIELDRVIAALDLGPLLARRVQRLSGGERQRVAIGRTLLTRPRLLLMDEPLAALDLRRKGEILPYIERVPDAFGTPIVYVTHAIEEVARLADGLTILHDGRIAADGPTEAVLERLDLTRAVERFEAGVVISAEVAGHDETNHLTRMRIGQHNLVMPVVDAPAGTILRLRIRARDVSLALERPRRISVRNIFPGTVTEVASEPDTAFAEVLIDLGPCRLRSRITRDAMHELDLRPGSAVYALVKSIAFDRRALAPDPEVRVRDPLEPHSGERNA